MPITRDGYLYDGKTVSSGLTTEAVVESSNAQDVQSSYDVIVVGAGFAGLVAARDLTRNHNLKVLILEARDRIGGRTWTSKAWGEEFEMGGTWVHWSQPNVYAEAQHHGLHKTLKMTAGIAALEQAMFKPPGGAALQELDIAKSDAQIEAVAAEFFTIDGMTARELMPYPHDPWRSQAWLKYDSLSVSDRLSQVKHPQDAKYLFEAHITSIGCGPANETSFTEALRWYALGGYSIQNMYAAVGTFKFGKGGMTNFAKHILAEYEGQTLFKKVVQSFRQEGPSKVVVTCTDKAEYSAKWVVCTVPLNCLSDVHFNPPLSSLRKEAVGKGQINTGAKVHFSIDKVQPNWFSNTTDSSDSGFLFAFVDHNGTQSTEKNGTFAIGFGYSGKLTDPTEHENMINEFDKLQPGGKVRGYVTHPWATDPFAKGVWYCAGPNVTTRYLQELQKPHGRIVFASADWADAWRGFVDGAIEQGSMAAAYIARAGAA